MYQHWEKIFFRYTKIEFILLTCAIFMLDINIPLYEKNILHIKKELDTYKPFSSAQLKNLQQWFKIWFTTHSNAIEWNSFSEIEVKILIEDGITVWWKTLKELKETQNLAELTDSIWKFFESDFVLDTEFILTLHCELLTWIEKKYLGKYRTTQVYISGSDDVLPTSKEVHKLMDEFITFCNSPQENILKKIAKIQYDFVKIHPFLDWNWRIARLLMNLFLVKEWFLPIIFPVITRLEYISSFGKDKTGTDFYKYFLWQTHENMKDYLRFFKD